MAGIGGGEVPYDLISEDEEISLEDVQVLRTIPALNQRKGDGKVLPACLRAQKNCPSLV